MGFKLTIVRTDGKRKKTPDSWVLCVPDELQPALRYFKEKIKEKVAKNRYFRRMMEKRIYLLQVIFIDRDTLVPRQDLCTKKYKCDIGPLEIVFGTMNAKGDVAWTNAIGQS